MKVKKIWRRISFYSVILLFLCSITIGYLAIQQVEDADSKPMFAAKLISKSIIMKVLDTISRISDENYVPTPIDSGKFHYVNLQQEYFSRIRTDPLLMKLFVDRDKKWDFEDAVNAADFLWANVSPGNSTQYWQQSNVIEMFQAAAKGEPFLCWNLSKMLSELVQAGGMQARLISLNRYDGIGHVVIEVYSKRREKWLLIDATNNLYYEYNGEPLNTLEVNQLVQNEESKKNILTKYGSHYRMRENNKPAVIDSKLNDFYKNGFAVEFYNRWVEQKLPRYNPLRSPSVMGVYVGESSLRKFYYNHNLTHDSASQLYESPKTYEH
jgi:hypothetical protein